MRLLLPAKHLMRLLDELQRIEGREIGGVLVGAQHEDDVFELVELSVQRTGGGYAHFQRDAGQARSFIHDAIARQGGDPTRTNYLGEWHSHPGGAARPSLTDMEQMQALVEDGEQLARFLVLMVVSRYRDSLRMSATLFRPALPAEPVKVVIIGDDIGLLSTVSCFRCSRERRRYKNSSPASKRAAPNALEILQWQHP